MYKPIDGKLSLHVIAPTPFDEVFVIDAGFNRIAKGLGELAIEVDAGLYTVKFKSGSSTREETLLVNEPLVTVDRREAPSEPDAHTSAAPLGLDLASRLRDFIHGTTAGYKIVKADPTGPATVSIDLKPEHSALADQFRIVDDEGREVCSGPALVNGNAPIAAGMYRLEIRSKESGYFHSCLPVEPGWTLRIWWPESRKQLVPVDDAAGMRLVMTPSDQRHEAQAKSWADKAMSALLAERRVVPFELLTRMPPSMRSNPILLLCCAHMLIAKSPTPDDWDSLRHVLTTLTRILPNHPDVQLLRLYAAKDDERPPARLTLAWPPMLWRTWRLLEDPFMRDRVVVPRGSVADEARQRAVSSPAWLTWKPARSRPTFRLEMSRVTDPQLNLKAQEPSGAG